MMDEKVRCACYTRKSVENATLDRDFNSLVSQREACENYIASQKGKGWICLSDHYDDGGYSGGNMNRPAMQRLKADIEAGKIDMVVCFKIDRLSRSIIDFVELQKFFEEHGVHFVSVTQDINTSTSSGRMLLNILITFASFERDLIIDRVKTAIEGGKKRGKFCGGVPMLGYRSDPYTKKLIVDPDEAKTVRLIFEKYVALESIQATVSEINRLGLRTREWVSVSTGKKHAAKPWNSTSIHRILTSPIYAGYVSHYDTNYEGEHEAIIPRPEWEKVQQMLEARSPLPRGQQRQRHFHPFDGHVICGHCNCALTPTYTKKQGRKYCYYICSRLNKDADHDCPVKRVPAGDLEHAVVSMLSGLFQAPSILRETLKAVRHKEELLRKNCERDVELLQSQLDEMKKQALKEDFNFEEVKKAADLLAEAKRKRNLLREPVSEDEVIAALGDAAGLWEFMFPGARHELLQLIVGDIVVYPDRISFVLKVDGLKDLASEMAVSGYFNEAHGDSAKLPETEQEILDDGSVRITMKMESKHIDGHRRVVIPAPGADRLKQTSLLRAINNARLWMDKLINGEATNVTDLSKQLGLKGGYVTRILSLNSLAPDIVEAILAGIEPDGLSIAKLTEQPIPEDWNEQRRLYGFPMR